MEACLEENKSHLAMNSFQVSSSMVSRKEEAVFFFQKEMDSFFWTRRCKDNWELKVLRLIHSNTFCSGLKVSQFSYLEKTLILKTCWSYIFNLFCSSATLNPEPKSQQCLTYCSKGWESPLWLPQKSFGFHSVSKLAISYSELFSFCKASNAVRSSQSILSSNYYHFSHTNHVQQPLNIPVPIFHLHISSQLPVDDSFSGCDAYHCIVGITDYPTYQQDNHSYCHSFIANKVGCSIFQGTSKEFI